ncbi:MAG TPA: hypothetical protein VK639_01070 [Terriglobales bacterium]|nr:hypothetical protein [Terriglobales bacterium]
MKRTVLLLLFNGLVWSSFSQDTRMPTILIQAFSADTNEITGWQQSFGKALTDMAIAEVAHDRKFGAWTPAGTTPMPDLLLVGTVTRFGAETVAMKASSPHSSFPGAQYSGRCSVRISWHLIDVGRGSELNSGVANGFEKGKGFKDPAKVAIDFGDSSFDGSALGKATRQAISNLVAEVSTLLPARNQINWTPVPRDSVSPAASSSRSRTKEPTSGLPNPPRGFEGKVTAVLGEELVIISLGSRNGLKKGDVLHVGRTIELLQGELTLEDVVSDSSKARYKGAEKIQIDWIVK